MRSPNAEIEAVALVASLKKAEDDGTLARDIEGDGAVAGPAREHGPDLHDRCPLQPCRGDAFRQRLGPDGGAVPIDRCPL